VASELKSALASGRVFDRRQCVRIMCELLDALDYAHEAGVVHRDIKPANVMPRQPGTRQADRFRRGADHRRRPHRRRAHPGGHRRRHPAYMSPEQIEGQRVDRRSDIFSAGIILYQFLTGQKPFAARERGPSRGRSFQEDRPIALLAQRRGAARIRPRRRPGPREESGRRSRPRASSHRRSGAAEGQRAIEEAAAATVVVPLRKHAEAPRPAGK